MRISDLTQRVPDSRSAPARAQLLQRPHHRPCKLRPILLVEGFRQASIYAAHQFLDAPIDSKSASTTAT
ncbi:AfsA-related hotdog domain-containing protein [Streptomyces sp. NRRL S-1824]|uniref:AfsA-related hotdog domain-containing protein n=1 Tax=Streptomyces sp. NRRL S-1824 TaxID=1463889 RepID=UPI001F1F3A35|nr:AfsA-related hotdog domain-containing protein [Streptomyces sp. NRRL S-1824]